jgi:hypothetical protein
MIVNLERFHPKGFAEPRILNGACEKLERNTGGWHDKTESGER